MKYYESTFKIKEYDYTFKLNKVSPVKLLSLSTLFLDKTLESTEQIFKFALENTQVMVLDKWLPVKEFDVEVYWPATMEDDIKLLEALVAHFMREVMSKLFTKSSK